jgi:hypothetical protein
MQPGSVLPTTGLSGHSGVTCAAGSLTYGPEALHGVGRKIFSTNCNTHGQTQNRTFPDDLGGGSENGPLIINDLQRTCSDARPVLALKIGLDFGHWSFPWTLDIVIGHSVADLPAPMAASRRNSQVKSCLHPSSR